MTDSNLNPQEDIMRRLFFICLAVSLAGSVSSVAGDSETAAALQHELRTLAHYPKPVREAMLALLNQPTLLAKLEPGGKNLDKTLEATSTPSREASRLLLQHPDVLKLLKDNPDALALAAKAFADDRQKTIAQLDQEEKDDEAAVDDFAKRLDSDQVALSQFKQAMADFAMQPGASALASGVSFGAQGVNVNSLPTPAFNNYVMSNADRYSSLSNVMTSQWLSSRNHASYDRSFHHWWAPYQSHFHHSLLAPDEHRHERLAELARYDRAHAHIDRDHRYDKFHEHAKDYPHLHKLPAHDPKKHVAVTLHHKPHHKDPHPAGHAHHPKGKDHVHVHRKAASHAHRMHHAHAGHAHHRARQFTMRTTGNSVSIPLGCQQNERFESHIFRVHVNSSSDVRKIAAIRGILRDNSSRSTKMVT